MRPFALTALLVLPSVASALPEAEEFLATYCIECHGPEKQKGERRFDGLSFTPGDETGIHDLQDIIDQLNLGEMPPSKAKQPSEEEKAEMIAEVTEAAEKARESLARTGSETVLRRLNRREYLNTVADLLHLDLAAFDPTAKFPQDGSHEHIDKVGEALVTSGYLLDQYLDAADALVEKALGPVEQPETKEWHFTKNFQQGQELSYSHGKVYNYRYLCVYEVPNTVNHEGGYAYLHEFQEGVPADGWYEISALAHSMHRDTPYDPAIFRMHLDEPFRLGIVPGEKSVGTLHHPQPIEPKLAETVVRDGEPQWVTMRVWLNQGQTPRFIFPNGMANCRGAFSQVANKYKDHWPKKDPYTGGIVEARRIVLQHGKMPHIRIHEVKVKGPIYDQWPMAGQREIFGEEGFRKENLEDILQRFADRAYRRPATSEEVDRLVSVAETRMAAGRSPRQATKDALKAALCSPAFLYLAEPGDEAAGRELGPHDLASRLSYFLWSTMPDAELRALADDGSLLREEVLLAQFERMLDHPRSSAFVSGFLDSWLNLRALGDMPPDRDAFEEYYANDLQTAMKEEIRIFTRHLLESDGPITDYLFSDYTFVNRNLAEHYKLDANFDPEKAHHFQRVALVDKKRRGGLLGMGGVLTVSANGIETSPVVRGVYLLENILGTPPAPPPDDVPPIDPDIRGATTIRDQLAKHRELATCNECHRNIDPPGFALENYDPIGGWRNHYSDGKKTGPEIDASGELASGEAFENVYGFKKLLLERKDVFARHLTDRLLTYATGRKMEALDRSDIDRIVATVAESDDGMRTLVREVVASGIFRSR